MSGPSCFIFGNEGGGLTEKQRGICDGEHSPDLSQPELYPGPVENYFKLYPEPVTT